MIKLVTLHLFIGVSTFTCWSVHHGISLTIGGKRAISSRGIWEPSIIFIILNPSFSGPERTRLLIVTTHCCRTFCMLIFKSWLYSNKWENRIFMIWDSSFVLNLTDAKYRSMFPTTKNCWGVKKIQSVGQTTIGRWKKWIGQKYLALNICTQQILPQILYPKFWLWQWSHIKARFTIKGHF